MSHVDGENFRSAVLQQAIREATGRSPDIEGDLAFAGNFEMRERALELDSTATNVAASRRDGDLVAFLHRIRRFGGDSSIDSHFAGHDRALCLVPARKKSALDERLIESDAFAHLCLPGQDFFGFDLCFDRKMNPNRFRQSA